LEKEYPDPVAHFKKVVEDMNRQEAEDNLPPSVTIDRKETNVNNLRFRKKFSC
jgi:hypothetical protein